MPNRTVDELRLAAAELERCVGERTAELSRANEQLCREVFERRRAERELAVFRQFAEAAGLGFGMGDLDGQIAYVNHALSRLLGEDDPEQMVGRPFLEFYPEDWEERRASEVLPALAKDGSWQGEVYLRSRQGKQIPTWNHVFLVRDEDGEPFRRAVIVADITEHKQAREALHQSHDELRAIYDGMLDGLMIWDRDTWGIVRVNASLCRMLGYSEAELLSLRIMDLHPKETASELVEMIRARIEGRFQGYSNVMLVQKGGTLSYAEVVSHPITCEGRPCMVTFFRDTTARRQAEDALRESEHRIRTILDSALDAVVLVDSQGRTQYWNPAAQRMFGYTAEEMLEREVHALLPAARYREQALRSFTDFARSGRGRAIGRIMELTAVRKDGREFPIEMSVSAFQMYGKWCAAAIVRDITDRRRSREALERERRTLEHMLSASDNERRLVAYDIHDGLAQQLAGALMQFDTYGSLKRERPQQAVEAFEAGMAMLRQGHAETRRLISGLRPPILDEFGVVAAIAHLVNDRMFEGGAEIEFRKEVSFERLSPVLETVIYRIVQEGLTNAFKYSQSERIRVTLAQRGDRIRVGIQDWGIGLTSPQARKDQYGLEGIRERARILGGKSRIRSRPGKGTSIVVELPLVEAEEER